MTVKEVRDAVAHINRIKGDYEAAHAREDALWGAVLAAIANGSCEDPAELACEALRTEDIDFVRYCA